MKKLAALFLAAALVLNVLGLLRVYQWHQEDKNDLGARSLDLLISTPPIDERDARTKVGMRIGADILTEMKEAKRQKERLWYFGSGLVLVVGAILIYRFKGWD